MGSVGSSAQFVHYSVSLFDCPLPLRTLLPGVLWLRTGVKPVWSTIVNGVVCHRRVRKLFLPPGAKYFGCRACYDLTYESAQSHDARVGKLMKNPWALAKALEGGDANQTILAFQAYGKLYGRG